MKRIELTLEKTELELLGTILSQELKRARRTLNQTPRETLVMKIAERVWMAELWATQNAEARRSNAAALLQQQAAALQS